MGYRTRIFGTSNGSWEAYFQTAGFLGLSFSIDGQNRYAWAYLSVVQDHSSGGYDGTLISYAYDTVAGQPLAAGQGAVPEPGTLGLLALGSLGLAFWRRRKAVASQQ
ncbi:MAG TPA: PEP-CTERM sorting domain-containing protein [Terriglobales bacterium]|nr:PEP-CTERM sorting domain-containing protein [Terriglobales bacterium]